ncbi:MAG: F0F1 ATP synthase subunit A [Anaerolineales bacterium]|nr:F0F1 ATP synthase subunit A [Anaerolineales bacterium]
MEEKTEKKGWRWGVNRWIVLAAILLGSYLFTGFFGVGLKIPVEMPHVALPAEPISDSITLPVLGEFYLTNTMTALLVTDLIIFLLAIAISRSLKNGKQVLTGLTAAVEFLLEYLYNITRNTAGKWTKTIFPWFATITLLVLAANWLELLPGVETVGTIKGPDPDYHYAVRQVGPFKTIVEMEHAEAAAHAGEGGYALYPWFRVVSSDLNFTVALALVAVIMVQVVGFRAQGPRYLKKFFYFDTLFNKPIFGVIDFGVGILELISEFSKILSFAFRLFGNIFAGTVLLFVIGSLVPVFAQSMFYLLEFFVGLIQAIVFGLLTMVFMAQAAQGHGDHEEAHA